MVEWTSTFYTILAISMTPAINTIDTLVDEETKAEEPILGRSKTLLCIALQWQDRNKDFLLLDWLHNGISIGHDKHTEFITNGIAKRMKKYKARLLKKTKQYRHEESATVLGQMEIRNLAPEDDGNYTCLVKTAYEGEEHNAIAPFNLLLYHPASVRILGPKRVILGQKEVRLQCRIISPGHPQQILQTVWYHSDKQVGTEDKRISRYQLDLDIEKAQRSDQGTYRCNVSNIDHPTGWARSLDHFLEVAERVSHSRHTVTVILGLFSVPVIICLLVTIVIAFNGYRHQEYKKTEVG